MRARSICHYKGDQGIDVEAVDIPSGQPRYAAISYGEMEEHEIRALDRGAIIKSAVLALGPQGWLHGRLDECHQ